MSDDDRGLRELIDAACDGLLTPDQARRLEAMLEDNEEAQWLYLAHMRLDGRLRWEFGRTHDVPSERETIATVRPQPQARTVRPSPAAGPSGGWIRRGGRFLARHVMSTAVLLTAVGAIALSIGLGLVEWPGSQRRNPDVANERGPNAESEAGAPRLPAVSVATLGRTVGCRWTDATQILASGDRLFAGRSLHLASGVAEIQFDAGAEIVLQGPAAIELEADKAIRLEAGKVTAKITRAAARGFVIHTAEATFADEGTEFGVEVSPGGSSLVHVFKGEILMSVKGDGAGRTHRLMENYGASLEAGSPALTLVEDDGEYFIRSIDDAERDRQVVAYWRFEDRPVGTFFPDTQRESKPVRATADSTFNGNDLFAYSRLAVPRFSADVAESTVPQTGLPNRGCLDNTMPPEPDHATRDLYTKSSLSHAAPNDLQTFAAPQWTIEASVKAMRLGRGFQTFIGHDNIGDRPPQPQRLRFQIDDHDCFAVAFVDAQGRLHRAVASGLTVRPMQWFHLAAVSDGKTLRLYVNALDGKGYEFQAATALPTSGSTAMSKAGKDDTWSIGCGRKGATPTEWFQGWIDEVRISDVALTPPEFLFAAKTE